MKGYFMVDGWEAACDDEWMVGGWLMDGCWMVYDIGKRKIAYVKDLQAKYGF